MSHNKLCRKETLTLGVAEIKGAHALALAALPLACPPLPRPFGTRFGQVEQQAAGDRIGFGKANPDVVAKREYQLGATAAQAVAAFIVDEVVVGQVAARQQAVGPGVGQGDEQAEPRDADDPSGEHAADTFA